MVRIGERLVGGDGPCFIIAEAGVNHNGRLDLALQMVELAARAGADAVKFQTFTAKEVASEQAQKAPYQLKTTDEAESQYQMLERLELGQEDFARIRDYCRQQEVAFLSTPYGRASADLLQALGVPAYKVSSGDLTNHRLLAHLAAKGRPLIVSTGMATLAEVEAALEAIAEAGDPPVVLLQCVSSYPARAEDCNLRAMVTMAEHFKVPVGFSDHTMGNEVALAAVALGACVIEKHFTLDRGLPGPDHQASVEPAELEALVRGIRKVEAALGHGRKEPAAGEVHNLAVARRSLVAACDIPAGAVLRDEMIVLRRPGNGLPPERLPELLGRTVRQAIPAGTIIRLDMLA